MNYVEGFLIPVSAARKHDYLAQASAAAPLFKDLGATRIVECWADDVPDGTTTDFKRAVKAEGDEIVVFSWIEYPSKEVRDEANRRMREDPRFKALGEMPFDGKRMIFGGFTTLIDR